MSAVLTPALPYRLGEYHPFESAGARFLYLVPSGAIFALDDIGREVVDRIGEKDRTKEELADLREAS